MEARILELERLIRYHQDVYYNGEAEISDADFDALWDELRAAAPDHPLLKKIGRDAADGFPKARHIIPMGSQDKAANAEAFLAWAAAHPYTSYLVQHKLDGASLELQYADGRLVRAVTRGDGVTGDDITANAKKMGGVLDQIDGGFSGGIRGEVVMLRDVWKKKYAAKANCRNAANGLMRRKDGAGSEDLTVITYDAAETGAKRFTTEREKLTWLAAQGFVTVAMQECKTAEAVVQFHEKEAARRIKLPYDIDGLVVKNPDTDPADLQKTRPEQQIAFKFEPEQAVSTLIAVEWSESGATYTPIGVVEPVRLAGTTVKRANLCNPAMIRNLGLKIGSRVIIEKRGEIIPKINRLAEEPSLLTEDITAPTVCIVCNTELVDEGTRLYCPNPACPKRLHHRIKKWAAVLDIRELGEKLINQLFEKGRTRRIADLYTLESGELALYDRMGDLSAEKVTRNIREKRELSLAAFIAGFDLEGIGETLMENITTSGFDTLAKLRAASIEELAAVFGIGDERARAIKEGLEQTADDMDAVLAAGSVTIAGPRAAGLPFEGVSFCFTGELTAMKRSEAEARVKALGGAAKSAVVKGLSYLVTNTPESGSAKNKKARELGIPIIDEAAFLALLA